MRAFLRKFLPFFVAAGVFSFVMNLLLLTPSLYMLQVYDRVLGSRSEETLWFITIMLLLALVVMGAMELVRSRLLVRANNAIDAQLAPICWKNGGRGCFAGGEPVRPRPEGSEHHKSVSDRFRHYGAL